MFPSRFLFTARAITLGLLASLATLFYTLVVNPHPLDIHGGVWAVAVNFVLVILVSRRTEPPSQETVQRIPSGRGFFAIGTGLGGHIVSVPLPVYGKGHHFGAASEFGNAFLYFGSQPAPTRYSRRRLGCGGELCSCYFGFETHRTAFSGDRSAYTRCGGGVCAWEGVKTNQFERKLLIYQ